MKIEGPGARQKKIAINGLSEDRHRVLPQKGPAFEDVLADTQSHARRERLDRLLKEIDAQAELLKGSRSLATLRRYRELIQAFLETAVGEAYQLQQQIGVDRRGRRRLYLLVKKVNTAVEELTQMVLDSQRSGLEILAKLGEIRGLLVDLYT